MKNKNILFVLISLFLLSSCAVTRSRYGNGIHIEMPEVFKRDGKQAGSKSHKINRTAKRNENTKKDSIRYSFTDSSTNVTLDNLLDQSADTFNKKTDLIKKVKSVVKKTSIIPHKRTKPTYTADNKNITSKSVKHTSNEITKTTQKQSTSDKGFIEYLSNMFVNIILGFIIGTLIVYLIIIILPPNILLALIIIANVVSFFMWLFE